MKKLKTELIKSLRRNPQNINEPYVRWRDGRTLTRLEYSNEIENETEAGIQALEGMIELAAHIMKKENERGYSKLVTEKIYPISDILDKGKDYFTGLDAFCNPVRNNMVNPNIMFDQDSIDLIPSDATHFIIYHR